MQYIGRVIAIGILVVLALLIGVFLGWPQYQKFDATNKRIENKEVELERQARYIASLHETARQLDMYEAELEKVGSSLPPDPAIPALFSLLDQMTTSSGLILNGIRVKGAEGAVVDSTEIVETFVELSVLGSYESIKGFVKQVRNSARLLDINSVVLNAEAGGEFTATLEVKAFSFARKESN